MKIGAIQSSFIPWRGYFDFISAVDIFVILDDVQFSKGGWRSRNKIKTPKGTEWITVPVKHQSLSQMIINTRIDDLGSWRKKHMGTWSANYNAAPYFSEVMKLLDIVWSGKCETISQLNVELIKTVCRYLDIKTPLIMSTDLSLQGEKTERLIDMMKKLNGSCYLSGPSADVYLDKAAFISNDFSLAYKSYDYPEYPQLWGEFDGAVTVLDLIANCGPDSMQHLKSRQPDKLICP